MAVALIKHQASGLSFELGRKETTLLVIRHLSMASILALNGCPGLVDHYTATLH